MASPVAYVCPVRACRVEIVGPLVKDGQQVVDWKIVHWSEPVWYAYVNPVEQAANGDLSATEQSRFISMADRMHADG